MQNGRFGGRFALGWTRIDRSSLQQGRREQEILCT